MKYYPTPSYQLTKKYPDASFYPPEFWSDEESYSGAYCSTEGCYGSSPSDPHWDAKEKEWTTGWSCPCGCCDDSYVYTEEMFLNEEEDWEHI